MKFSLLVVMCTGGVADGFAAPKFAARGHTPLFATNADATTKGSLAPIMNSYRTKPPVFDEVCDTTGVTLTRFMDEVAMLNPELRELTTLFGAIDTACKAISNLVKRSQLPSSETLGYEEDVDVQGECRKVSL